MTTKQTKVIDIFVDESGYSGINLMDAGAPVFVLASTCMDKKVAQSLLSCHFPVPELHFTEHKADYHSNMLEFMKELRLHRDKFHVSVGHKPFITFIKVIDFWIEPTLEIDHDFYDRKYALGFANAYWHAITTERGERFLSDHLQRFCDMLRSGSQSTYNTFWTQLEAAKSDQYPYTTQFIKKLCESNTILSGAQYVEKQRRKPIPILDILLTFEAGIALHWNKRTKRAINLFHDAASEFEEMSWIWTEMTQPWQNEPCFLMDGELMPGSADVRQTKFIDSRSSPEIQICDFVAGATAEVFKVIGGFTAPSKLSKGLMQSGILSFTNHLVWPNPNSDMWLGTDENAGAAGYLDHISQKLSMIAISKNKSLDRDKAAETALRLLASKEYSKALKLLRFLSKEGILGFSLLLGFMYSRGFHVPKISNQAEKYFAHAIETTDPTGTFLIALQWALSYLVKSVDEFVVELKKSARNGSAEGAHKLSMLYQAGLNGVSKEDPKKAFYWARKGASLKHHESMRLLGAFHYHGYGTEVNRRKAKIWYTKAAKAGNREAFEYLLLTSNR